MLWIVAGVAAVGAALWGPMASNVEQAKYTVVKSDGAFELRDYAPHIVAEARVKGEREAAINDGFRIIAGYIFGGNQPKQNVAMTAPVMQTSAGENVAMTAPVTQTAAGAAGEWVVRFVMPASYTMETLPKPNDERVELIPVAEQQFAVVRFSGTGSEENLAKQEALLRDYLAKYAIKTHAAATYAFYNPPWTLPFLRRNEVMIQVK